jgi:hypothetical protein
MTKLMVVIGFLIAFAAGLTVGLEVRRTSVANVVEPPTPVQLPTSVPTTSTRPTTRQSRPPSWIVSQLKLDEDQQEKMNKIWSNVARDGREESERRRDQLRRERDEAILALVGPANKEKYEAVYKKYHEDQKQVERDVRARFEKAVEETIAILNPEQQKKYKDMLSRHRPGGDRDRDRDRDRNRGDNDRRDGERRGDRGNDDDARQEYATNNDDDGDGDHCKNEANQCEQAPGPRDARNAAAAGARS